MALEMLRAGRQRKLSVKIVGGMALIVMAIGITLLLVRLNSKPTPHTAVSKGGRIVLNQVTPGMKVGNNSPIAGTYQPNDGATLYYVVTTKDHKSIGGGNILPSERNHFSRNINLTTKDHANQDGQLEIYLQDASGKRLDSMAVPIKIQ